MRILVVGATGAIGRRLVPLLVANDHAVKGTTRTPGKADEVLAAGADPLVLDLLHRVAVRRGLREAEPEEWLQQPLLQPVRVSESRG
jgi:uncharacterized protein YbjT (DUF2867 family)